MATIKSELDYIQEARSQLAEALITKFGVRRYDNAKDNPTLKGLWTVKADGSADKLKRLHDWALLVTGTNVHTDASLTFKNDGKGDAVGTTFNGSVARSISYNSIGAAPAVTGGYLPLSGGTMTGQIKGNNKGGSWIAGRTNAAIYLSRNTTNDWHPVIGFKTKTGSWEFGSVGSDDLATFSWGSDSNYSSGTNSTTTVSLRTKSGTIALTSEIPTKASWNYDDVYSKLGHTHTTTIAASTDTNQIALVYGGKYKLTAGGTSYVFTMPASDNTWRPIGIGATDAAAGNHVHKNLIIKWGAGDTEGTNLFTYNGSTAKTINLSAPFSLLFTSFGNVNTGFKATNITATISGVTKSFEVNWATYAGNTNNAKYLVPVYPETGGKFWYYWGLSTLESTYGGSSSDYSIYSYPKEGAYVTNSYVNIQNLRLQWSTTYFHDIFASPNARYLWHRDVSAASANAWARIVEENCSNYTRNWNISIAGNSASATKLQTARNIWGQPFDGTANISGTLSGVANILFNADNTYDIGSNSAASKYIYTYWLGAKSGLKLELGANNSSYGLGLCIDTNLNVGIGTNSPSQKLHINGNAIATNLGVNASGGGNGISLFSGSGNVAIYGIAFNQTSNWGTHGYVTSDWATYFTMNNLNNRGWIFKRNGSGNVFSIDTSGLVYANGRINGNYYTSRVATGTQPYSCTSTTLNTNLNSDLLDGYHASSFESYHKVTIDTTGLNSNTWYPVTMAIGNAILTRIRIEGNTSTTGTWNTRSDKLMSVELDYTTQGSSWGWVSPFRTIFLFNLGAGASGSNCIAGIGLLENSGTEYVYVRGGAKYNFYVSRFITPTLRTSTYTINSQSISPTTTSPTVIHRNNALISDMPTVTNYYWANVKISTSSNTATNPTFGNTTTNKLTISNTEAIGHLVFSRGNYNYITAPTSGMIGFCVNGNTIGSANCDLIISGGNIFPGTTNVTYLGKSSNRWNTIYSALGDFTSYVKTSSYITFGDHGYYLTSDIRNSWRTSIYGNNASGSRLRTVRTEITIDNFSEQYGSGLAWATGDTQGYLSVSYSSGKAWIGGGNKDKLNWSTYLVTGNNIGSQSVNLANLLKYTGLALQVFTVAQTHEDFCGRSGWATYLIGNHGNGSTYYHQVIAMPFDGMPQYQRLENGTQGAWYTFAMMGYANSGDLYAAHFYENSDIRYKEILNDLSINTNIIATLPLFDFKWIENNTIGTGTSAQAVQEILPNIVSGTDKLTLDYGVLGTIAGITACKELVAQKSEIDLLKERIELLELQLKMINDYGRC